MHKSKTECELALKFSCDHCKKSNYVEKCKKGCGSDLCSMCNDADAEEHNCAFLIEREKEEQEKKRALSEKEFKEWAAKQPSDRSSLSIYESWKSEEFCGSCSISYRVAKCSTCSMHLCRSCNNKISSQHCCAVGRYYSFKIRYSFVLLFNVLLCIASEKQDSESRDDVEKEEEGGGDTSSKGMDEEEEEENTERSRAAHAVQHCLSLFF